MVSTTPAPISGMSSTRRPGRDVQWTNYVDKTTLAPKFECDHHRGADPAGSHRTKSVVGPSSPTRPAVTTSKT